MNSVAKLVYYSIGVETMHGGTGGTSPPHLLAKEMSTISKWDTKINLMYKLAEDSLMKVVLPQ